MGDKSTSKARSTTFTDLRLVAVLLLLAFVVGIGLAQSASAQSAAPGGDADSEVLAPCRDDATTISAQELPATVELDQCPLSGREIEDNGIGTTVPPVGFAIYAESYGPAGSQELTVTPFSDGTIGLAQVGSESSRDSSQTFGASRLRTSQLGACSDTAYTDRPYTLRDHLRYYFNCRTTPRELAVRSASRTILKAGRNLARSRNDCGLRDHVPAHMIYEGSTHNGANISSDGHCTATDNQSVIGFGTLPRGSTATTCDIYAIQSGYDRPTESDTRINKARYTWTTHPLRRSCKHRYDLESTVTHERGHTFGLGHVSESQHGSLTMSPTSEGPCQLSERTLGRGDVRGLNNKYN